jgi:EPS-associated MarR family transcriptional regulator
MNSGSGGSVRSLSHLATIIHLLSSLSEFCITVSEQRQLDAMRLLETNPEMTQRELAEALGVSLGAANYCLKALVNKGWVKFENFQNNPNKLGYLYLLTPAGMTAKTALAARFLRRKLVEYEALRAEIDRLQCEVRKLG